MSHKHIIPFLCMLCLIGCSCRKKPTDGTPPVYDSRNVSRNTSKSNPGNLAVSTNGTVHVVWCDDATGQFKTYYSCKPVGGSWSAAIDISGNTTRACSAPQIAIDPSGNLHAVWDELGTVPGSHAMYVNRPFGGNWSAPQDISNPTTPNGSLPQIGIDGGGKVYVVYDGGGGGLWYTVRDNIGIWSTPIEFSPLNSFGNPSLAVSQDGQMHVDFEDNGHNINYMHRSAAGVWDSAMAVSKTPADYCWISNITVGSNGTVYASWSDATTGEVLFSIKALGDTIWSAPYNVSNSAAHSWISHMAVGTDSIVHYIWAEDVTTGSGDVYYKKRYPDGTWSAATNISNTSSDSRPSGVILYGSRIYFTWGEYPEGEVFCDSYSY